MNNLLKKLSSCAFATDRIQIVAWDFGRENLVVLKAELSELLTPGVMEFLPEPMQLTKGRDPIARWIAARDRESKVFCVRDIVTQELLGLFILAPFLEENGSLDVRLGYLLSERTWGKGIATELVKGFISWCKQQQVSARLLGGVEKANPASAAVLIKAGFKRAADLSSTETNIFQLTIGAS